MGGPEAGAGLPPRSHAGGAEWASGGHGGLGTQGDSSHLGPGLTGVKLRPTLTGRGCLCPAGVGSLARLATWGAPAGRAGTPSAWACGGGASGGARRGSGWGSGVKGAG